MDRARAADVETQSASKRRGHGALLPHSARDELFRRYADRLQVAPLLSRRLVSFQGNRETPFYRWMRYKEGFSSDLVRSLLQIAGGPLSRDFRVLDPFAGIGTTLTTTALLGGTATGVEILPVGVAAIRARLRGHRVDGRLFRTASADAVSSLEGDLPRSWRFPHLRITRGAFSRETELAMSAYMTRVESRADGDVKVLLRFACMSILEDVSFTRKDGQYLRWDRRAGRSERSAFLKGKIPDFRTAITEKLGIMLEDIMTRKRKVPEGSVKIIQGSSLAELPKLPSESFHCVITSPPYANRYDYTRTYALELAFLGIDDLSLKDLRQALLSCTVENRSKREDLEADYAAANRLDFYQSAVTALEEQKAVSEVMGILNEAKDRGSLNNGNIPKLVANYLFEMNLVIWEIARILLPGGKVFLVNDNVRYHGEEIPVDLILSDLATAAGLNVERIWVLPKGKGNSSQQMGRHGRAELRKCVYFWTKPSSV